MTLTRDELLAAYASGETSPGLSLLCATHLTLSEDARAFVGAMEELGGAFLTSETRQETVDFDAGSAMSFDALLARVDAEEDAEGLPLVSARSLSEPEDLVEDGPIRVPRPLARALQMPFSSVPWKFRLPSIHEHVMADFKDEKVSLMRAKPGARVPSHTHSGVEATLVLGGAMQDGEHKLTAGDIALCGPEHDHHPEIIGDETCYCLIVVDGKLRFTGTFGPALNLFAE